MKSLAVAIPLGIVLAASKSAHGTLPLETESARIMAPGTLKVEAAFEYQTSQEGRELAAPLVIEYAFFKDFQLEIEPVFYTAILPAIGKKTVGVGDLEATGALRVIREDGWVPNIAAAVEVKVPTARDSNIGTGEFDYTGYIFVSKRFFDQLDLHLNGGYTFVGSPPGVKLKNTFSGAAALDWHVTRRLDLLTEVLGTTSSLPAEEPTTEGTGVAAEASGGELVGLLGARFQVLYGFYASVGVTYDNQQATLIRTGLTWKWPTPFAEHKSTEEWYPY